MSPWWIAENHMDRRPALTLRANLVTRLRAWFADQGFTEVEPACLQVSPGNETHLHAFATDEVAADGTATRLYLHTSPEFAMKKLLAAGESKIFALTPVFRNRESGPLHLREFTMLEWYRAASDYQSIQQDCASLLSLAARVRGTSKVTYKQRTCDLGASPQVVSVADAFMHHAGIDLLATISGDGTRFDREAFAAQTQQIDTGVSETDNWSDIFAKVLTSCIEPKLGLGRPTLLIDYPLPEAALARVSTRDPRLAERFELYCCGIELANGFSELTDANEQRRRFETAMNEKERIYGTRYPIDEAFIAALDRMPEAAGAALGFDRLVMLAAGAERLDQVVWTPPEPNAVTSGRIL